MISSNGHADSFIDKRDFDVNRPLIHSEDGENVDEGGLSHPLRSRPESPRSRRSTSTERGAASDDGLLSDVVEGIVERDRRQMQKEVVRVVSFIWGVITWYDTLLVPNSHLVIADRPRFSLGAGSITAFSLYGHLLLTRLHYTQLRVNAVSIAAEIAMYLLVPLFGYLCDRYSPSPLALSSGVMFGLGYLVAAFTYQSGPPADSGGSGWPFWVMVVAFVFIGMGTSCMYLAAVATCAKNYGRGKHKGIMLAIPIAAFGLSGMWQSQIGTYLLCESNADGSRGDVDVFRYFVFLGLLLFGIGLIGTFALRIVDGDEERYIDETVEELERSGLLEESEFFRPRNVPCAGAEYGTFSADEESVTLSGEEREERRLEKQRAEEERRKKNWLLNYETRVFLQDPTMWWLAAGFFLDTGPGESYITNVSSFVAILWNILTNVARHYHSHSHSQIILSGRSSACGPPIYTCNYSCTDIDNCPSYHWISFGFLCSTRYAFIPSNSRTQSAPFQHSNS